MADSERYYGIQMIAEEINDAYEDIKKVRRALFGRLKEENMKSSVTKTQKRELRVLWRHMNRAYKKLTQEPEDYSLTRKQIGKLTVPWTMYLVALMRIKEEIFKHEHVDEGDEGATIHGPDWTDEVAKEYTVAQVQALFNDLKKKCHECEISIEKRKTLGYDPSVEDRNYYLALRKQADAEQDKFERKYEYLPDIVFNESEVEHATQVTERYLAFLNIMMMKSSHYAKTYERKMEPTLTDLLNNLKVAHSRS